MSKNTKNGFTLVELLAVIVILAIILVIAVPQIMNVIKDTTKASLESSAKMVAAQVENQYTVAQTLGKSFGATGSCMEDCAGLNETDYASCTYEITSDGNAKVTIGGKGKFNGLSVCNATRSSATAYEGDCITPSVSFEEDDWETIVSAVKQAETNGIEYPYNVGDEKTIDLGTTLGTHTIRIANKTKCSSLQTQPVSQTACGFVLEFKDIITTHEMNGDPVNNTGATNVGGWPASEMRTYVNEEIYNAIPEALRNGIIDTYVVSSHGSGDEGTIGENKNFYSTDKLYLLSPGEIYGTSFTVRYDSSNGTSRQLDYYANYKGEGYTGVSNDNNKMDGAIKYSGNVPTFWWVRSSVSNSNNGFWVLDDWGSPWSDYITSSDSSYGVSPVFRIAE